VLTNCHLISWKGGKRFKEKAPTSLQSKREKKLKGMLLKGRFMGGDRKG